MLASPVNQTSKSSAAAAQFRGTSRESGADMWADSRDVRTTEALLVLTRESDPPDAVLLTPGRWSIGSADGNRVQISGDGVGARHCLVVVTDRRTIIRSWDAQTRVNGQPISDSELTAGDELHIGDVRFALRSAGSSELISQLPDISGATDEAGREDSQVPRPVGNVLERMDQLCDAVGVLQDELHGHHASAERLDLVIDQMQQETAPHVSGDGAAEDSFQDVAGQLDGVLNAVDQAVNADDSGRHADELDARWRQLESFSSSLEVRAAIVEVQTSEIDQRLARFEQERRELAAAWSEVRQLRESVAKQQQEIEGVQQTLHGSREELDLQREAVDAEARDLKRLYETLASEFPEQAARLADGAFESETENKDGDLSTTDSVDAPTHLPLPVSSHAVEAPATGDGVGSLRNDASLAAHESSNLTSGRQQEALAGCKAVAPQESSQGLVRTTPYESPWEVSELISERIRCGQLIEELKPGTLARQEPQQLLVGDAIEDEDAVDLVGVGAPSLMIHNTTTNALRSRDEAVRQLDELVRVAQNSRESGDTLIPSAGETVSEQHYNWPDSPALGLRENPENDRDHTPVDSTGDETSEPAATAAPAATDSASHEPTSSVETDIDSEPESEADAEANQGEIETNSVSLLDRLRSTVAAELETPRDDVAVEPVAERRSSQASDTGVAPGSRLSTMFEERVVETETPAATDEAASSATIEHTASTESEVAVVAVEHSGGANDEAGDGGAEEVDGLRAHLADMFNIEELVPEKSADEASLDERFSTFYEGSNAESGGASESVGATEAVQTDAVHSAAGADAEASDGATNEPSIQEYMQQLLARTRGQDATSSVGVDEPDKEVAESAVMESVPMDDEDADRSWLTEGPRHKQDRRQVEADTQKFRELANESARSAVVTSTRKQLRAAVIVKTIASCLALLIGAVALLLSLPKVFGFGILGIGAVFTIDLCMTIGKNWSSVSRLARAERRGNAKSSGAQADASDDIDVDTPARRHDDPKPEVNAKVPIDRLARTLQAELKAGPGDSSLSFDGLLAETFAEDASDSDAE